MVSIKRAGYVMPLYLSCAMLIFLSGCSGASSSINTLINLKVPAQALVRTFDLSSRQGLRDIAGEFTTRASGADTGIRLFPTERVEVFASGSARVQSGGKVSGPEGVSTCSGPVRPVPSLPCYSVIYSVGINGRAGEVGTHIAFGPTTIGNLFLGINSPNLAANTGTFHMTVLVMPPGTFTGLWVAPENAFTVQGTTLKLSARVFAQDAVIDDLQFTVLAPGQIPVPVCQAKSGVKDIYTCDWDMTLNGDPFHNGPITLGFVLDGHPSSNPTPAPVTNPDGMRTGGVVYVETQANDNYSGYAATDFVNPLTYQKVTGHWTVPSALCSPGESSLSAIWVGMSSNASDQSLLAQLGTDSDCEVGAPTYYLWWEMFPAPSVPLDLPLQPGDVVSASVVYQHNTFQISIDVPTRGDHFSTTHVGKPSDASFAECIVEAPTIIDDLATNKGHLAQLTDFGQVSMRCQLNDNQPLADGPQNVVFQMRTDAGVAKATTSPLDQTGTTFTVHWHHG